MKSFFIFTFSLISFISFTQQRITSYFSENDASRTFVKEVDGQNYLINIYKNDEFKVSKLVKDNPTLLYSSSSYGLGTSSEFNFYKSKIITFIGIGISYFDFITKESGGVTFASGTGGIIGDQLLHANQNSFIVKGRTTNSSSKEYFYFDFSGEFKVLPLGFIPSTVGEQHVFAQKKISSSKNEYYIYSPNNERAEILVDATDQTHGIHFSDNKAWYIENENYVQTINLSTYKRTDLGIKSFYNKPYKKVITQGDQMILYQGTKDTTYLELYDLISKTKIKDLKYKTNGYLEFNYMRWDGDYIYFKTSLGTLGSINIKTDKMHTFEGKKEYTFQEWPLIKNRYLLAQTSSSIQIQDLHSGAQFETPWSSSAILDNPNIIDVGDYFYASMKTNNIQKSVFHKITLGDKTIEPSKAYEDNNSGLFNYSKLNKLNNDITLLAEDIYKVKNGEATKVNQSALLPNKTFEYQAKADGKIYYFSLVSDSLHFYSYEQGVESNVLVIEKPDDEIISFGVTPLFVYTVDKSGKFFRTNRNNKQSVRLNNFENASLSYYNFVHQGSFFFNNGNQLRRLKDDGTSSIEFNSDNFEIIQMEENMYLKTSNELLIWTDNKFETLNNTLTYPNVINVPEQPFHLVSSVFGRRWGILNNASLEFIPYNRPQSVILNQQCIGKDFALFNTDLNENILLDYKNKSFVFFEPSHPLVESKIKSIFIIKDDTLALVYDDAVLKTYKMTNYFKEAILVSESLFEDVFSTAKTTINGEYGLVQSSSNYYYISQIGKVTQLPDINVAYGDDGFPEINGEDIYFLASEFIWGRQLYSLRKNDINSTENIDPNLSQNAVRMFPNPTTNIINLSDNHIYSNQRYTIIDQNGRLIQEDNVNDGKIMVDKLQPGQYYLKLIGGKELITRPFIKI